MPIRAVFLVQDIGFPMMRRRYYASAINLERLVWVGPRDAESLKDDFMTLFGAVVVLDGDAYACIDAPSAIVERKQEVLRKRGIWSCPSDAELEDFFTPCAREHIQALRAKQRALAKSSFGTCFVGDASQSAERARGGHWMPTIARSSTMVSLSANEGRGHIFTAGELDFAMGWPSVPLEPCRKYAAAIPSFYSNLGSFASNPTQMAGNGMMLQQVAAWQLYLWGNVIRRDLLQQWRPPLRVHIKAKKGAGDDPEAD